MPKPRLGVAERSASRNDMQVEPSLVTFLVRYNAMTHSMCR
jgi:hypothetical protein